MRQIDRDRGSRRTRQRAAADLCASGADADRERQAVERGDDPLGAPRSVVVRTCSISRTGMRGVAAQVASTVASSAARISLSQRSARKSGSFLSAATSLRRPAMMPACGPPSSLSPLKQTRSTPRRMTSAGVGSCSSPVDTLGVDDRAAAEVLDEGDPFASRERREVLGDGDSTKPSMKKLLRWTFRTSAVWRVDRAGVVVERRLVRRANFA